MVDNYIGLPLWTPDGQLIQNYENQGYFDITPFDYNSSLNTKQYNLIMRGNSLTTVNDKTGVRLLKCPGPNHDTWFSCGTHSSVNGSSNSDFTITSTNVVGFSWFNFGGGNENPLPVELLYFEGIKHPLFNLLEWSTASEYNSDYFKIEKSVDGENWLNMSTITASGNSTQEIKYSIIDLNVDPIINYLQQIITTPRI